MLCSSACGSCGWEVLGKAGSKDGSAKHPFSCMKQGAHVPSLARRVTHCAILPKYLLSFPLKFANSPITGQTNKKKGEKKTLQN